MTTVTLDVRFEVIDGLEVVWWADSPDVEGFYASSSSMELLREQAATALSELLGEITIVERLVNPHTVQEGDRDKGIPAVLVAAG